MLALKHMSNEPNHTVERLRFREHYRSLTDDDLARLSMDENLVPAAREEITEELQVRGLGDLSAFRKRFAEEATVSRSEGFIGVLPREQKDLQLFGATVLVMFGLVGVHKWLLGDATTWRKEESLALWLFFALMFTWEPVIRLIKRQASGKSVVWLMLGLLYFAVNTAPLAVPALGRLVNGFNPLLVIATIASPAIVLGLRWALRRFASRSL